MLVDAAVNADDQPFTVFDAGAIVKWRLRQRAAHQAANVVVTGYTVHRHSQFAEHFAKLHVSAGAVVLNQVTGNHRDVGAPVASLVVREHRGQRVICHGAAQAAVFGGKQVWVRKVQNPQQSPFLVPVVVWLVGPSLSTPMYSACSSDSSVSLAPIRLKVQSCDLLVEVLRQYVDLVLVVVAVLPQLDLCQHLVGEGIRHDKARVTGGAAKINQPAFGQQDDALAVRENNVIDLRLDVFPLVLLQMGDVDFVVEMADVADDGLILQALELRAASRHDSCPSQ